MWHISGERNAAKWNFLVSAFDAEFAIGKFNVGIACFHEVGSNFLGLGFNFVERAHEGGATNRNGA